MLNLRGSVRNLTDGRVEVQLAGEEAAAEVLINWLKIGPKHAKVTTIEVVDLERIDSPEGRFEISPTV